MNSKWLKIGMVAVLIGLLAVGTAAYAQGPRGGQDWGEHEHSLIAVAADTLGLTQTNLVAELQSGKTIADIAAAQDVALDDIVEAFLSAHQERLTTAVSNGWLTQEQADLMIINMETNITTQLSEPFDLQFYGMDGMGNGSGMHHGGRHGMGGMGGGMGYGDGLCDQECPFNQERANQGTSS
jgi:hypothetical protein